LESSFLKRELHFLFIAHNKELQQTLPSRERA